MSHEIKACLSNPPMDSQKKAQVQERVFCHWGASAADETQCHDPI